MITQSDLPSATHIRDCRLEADDLVIEVSHATTETKVDIVATSFTPTWNLLRPAIDLPIYHPRPSVKADSGSAFLMERILDEETRYIMERRKTKTFPGNMLERPGKILRRLAEENTVAFQQDFSKMLEGKSYSSVAASSPFSSEDGIAKIFNNSQQLNCEFLANTSRVFYRLPVVNGSVQINKEKFAGCRNLQIITWNGRYYDQFTMRWADTAPKTRERTLVRTLDVLANTPRHAAHSSSRNSKKPPSIR